MDESKTKFLTSRDGRWCVAPACCWEPTSGDEVSCRMCRCLDQTRGCQMNTPREEIFIINVLSGTVVVNCSLVYALRGAVVFLKSIHWCLHHIVFTVLQPNTWYLWFMYNRAITVVCSDEGALLGTLEEHNKVDQSWSKSTFLMQRSESFRRLCQYVLKSQNHQHAVRHQTRIFGTTKLVWRSHGSSLFCS